MTDQQPAAAPPTTAPGYADVAKTAAANAAGRPGFRCSLECGKIFGALAKAQTKFRTPQRTKQVEIPTKSGGKYKFEYADLAEVINATRDGLAANGLATFHSINNTNSNLYLTTVLAHESGEWISSGPVFVGNENTDPKDLGAAITYLRRYTLAPLLGVAAEDDDDAPGNGEPDKRERRDRKAAPPAGGTAATPHDSKVTTPVPRWTYKQATGILRELPNGGGWQEVNAAELSLEDLREALVVIEERGKRFKAEGKPGQLEDARRDHVVVKGLITAKEAAGPDQTADQKQKAAQASPPATPPAATAPAPTGPVTTPPAQTSPLPAVEVDASPVNLGLDLQVAAIKPIDQDEARLLTLLTEVEVMGMALHPGNVMLFSDAVADEIAAAAKVGDPEPLSPAWLTGPWLAIHEPNVERRRMARKLLRMAIEHKKLGSRWEARHEGSQGKLALDQPPKVAPPTKREPTADEREHIEQVRKAFNAKTRV